MRKQGVESGGLPVGQIIIGIVVSALTGVAGAGLIAFLTGKGTVDEGSMKMAMVFVNLVSGLIGCLTAVLMAKRSVLVVSSTVAAAYFLLLLCGNLLFAEGGMDGVLWTALMIVAGAVSAVLIGIRGFRSKKTRSVRVRK